MSDVKGCRKFSLLGGPLHRLGCRLHLVRFGTNTVRLGLVLGILPWSILVVLALIGGVGHRLLSLSVVAGHVRLLVVIPLFFLCESLFDSRASVFVGLLARSQVVRGNAQTALETEIARSTRWKDSPLPDAVCLLAAVLSTMMASQLPLPGATAAHDPGLSLIDLPAFGHWFWTMCLTLFRFLMLRWLCRIGLWWHFLWRMAKLDLHLVPTHPDGAGGLGYLEVVQAQFTPLVLAISIIQAAWFAEEIATGKTDFAAIYPELALIVVVDAVLFLGPLCVFSAKLWACRVKGLSDYMELAARYVDDFDVKWLGRGAAPKEPLLGTADIQSLADLSNSVAIVRNIRLVPLSARLVMELLVAALVPMLPLLLLRYPIAVLAEKFFTSLSGL
jgi:hypothetical protein